MPPQIAAPSPNSTVLPPVRTDSFLSRLGSAALGFVTGGPAAAITGAITDPLGRAVDGPPPVPRSLVGGGPCPPGYTNLPGIGCVDPRAALPGGRPAVVPTPGTAVVPAGPTAMVPAGAVGPGGVSPAVISDVRRQCPTGMVLGKDGLCYWKGHIKNRDRAYPKRPKPPVTAHEAKLMRAYGPNGSKRKKVKRLAVKAGYTCKNK